MIFMLVQNKEKLIQFAHLVYVTIILIDDQLSSDFGVTGMNYAFKQKSMAQKIRPWVPVGGVIEL